MYMHFTEKINNIKSLWKTYTNEEMVKKVLCCLNEDPKSHPLKKYKI